MKTLLNLLAVFFLVASPAVIAADKHPGKDSKKHECSCTKECKEKCKHGKAADCKCEHCDCGKGETCKHCNGGAHEAGEGHDHDHEHGDAKKEEPKKK